MSHFAILYIFGITLGAIQIAMGAISMANSVRKGEEPKCKVCFTSLYLLILCASLLVMCH